MVKGFEVGASKSLHAFLRAEGVQSVKAVAEHGAAHRAKAALQQLILLRLDGGELGVAFALEGSGWKRRIEQDIFEQVQTSREVVAERLGVDPETVVAAKTV